MQFEQTISPSHSENFQIFKESVELDVLAPCQWGFHPDSHA